MKTKSTANDRLSDLLLKAACALMIVWMVSMNTVMAQVITVKGKITQASDP
ncbi:hypothetical protein [Dyadobacter sp. NIV53]|uniref:hypothetical protein n=1 Tax=Dyadobacter sp. NIV53 TaxID=2861765 RepID=UPI001E331466|nr:hypothetical protein [Dyadobacter sp. NIV53]